MNAIIFPGQGAQYKGMGKDLFDNFSKAKGIFSRIDKVLEFNISDVCFNGSEDELKQTGNQQLAILSVSLAAYELFKDKNIKIDFLSGLSLGEYVCLYAAEVIRLDDLVILVKERALAMQEAANATSCGMLAVIGLERKVLEEEAKELGFFLANINSSQQMVISLKRDNMAVVTEKLQALGAKVIALDVNGGFHSPFIASAKARLKKAIESLKFNDAKIPIVSNFTALPHTNKEEIKRNLIEQLVSPVLLFDCVNFMTSKGVDTFYEIGPSKVLKGLIRKINPNLKVVNIEKKEDLMSLS